MAEVTNKDVLKTVEANFEIFLRLWTKIVPIFGILIYAIISKEDKTKLFGLEFDLRTTAILFSIVLVGLQTYSSRCLASIINLIFRTQNTENIIFYIRNHPSILNPFLERHRLHIPNPSPTLIYHIRGPLTMLVFLVNSFVLILPYSGILGLSIIYTLCLHAIQIVFDPTYYSEFLHHSIPFDLTTYVLYFIVTISLLLFIFLFVKASRLICSDDFAARMWVSGGSFILFSIIGTVIIRLLDLVPTAGAQ